MALTASSALATNSQTVGVCAVTGNQAIPYNFIQVSQSDLSSYQIDPYNVIGVTSVADCPTSLPNPQTEKRQSDDTALPTPIATPSPSPSAGEILSASTTTQTPILPDTGGSAK